MFNTFRDLYNNVPASDRLNRINSVGAASGILINVALGTSFSVSLIMLAFGAFRYVVSSGDPKLIEKAYHTMFWSFLAMLASLLSIVIKNAVIQTYGITNANIVSDQPGF